MDPDEVEYLSENSLITIIPNFNLNTIHLISGDIGPFRASIPIQVPIWVAMHLKIQQRCIILAPDWMSLQKLEEIKESEKGISSFTPMPSQHYMVEAKLLLSHAAEDIVQSDAIKTAIKDIWDIRMSKLRAIIDNLIKSETYHESFDNLTEMEICTIRPLIPDSLDCLYRFKTAGKDLNQTTISTLQQTSSNTSFSFTS